VKILYNVPITVCFISHR